MGCRPGIIPKYYDCELRGQEACSVEILFAVLGGLAGLIIVVVIGIALNKRKLLAAFEAAQNESKKLLENARSEADKVVKQALAEAKDEQKKRRTLLDEEARQRRTETQKLEQKIQVREKALDKKLELLERRETEIESTTQQLTAEQNRYKALEAECKADMDRARQTLEKIAQMSKEEAKRELIRSMQDVARKEAQDSIRQIEENARLEAEKRARGVISLAVQRISSEYVNDSSISVVALPSEDMKGRIIGREGRNIRALEQATGVDLIIDDTPEAVILSCFNPFRREIAKITLEKLIGDGRIHPARIEETAKKEWKQNLTKYFKITAKEPLLIPGSLTFILFLRRCSVSFAFVTSISNQS